MASNKDDNPVPGIIAGVVGGALFLIFWLVLKLPFWVGLGAGVLGWVGSFLVGRSLSKPKSVLGEGTQADWQRLAGAGIDPELVERTIKEGSEQQHILNEVTRRLPASIVRARLLNITDLIGKIVDDVRHDPKDARAASSFLGYYADTCIKIARIYEDLTKKGGGGPKGRETMAQVENILGPLQKAFETHLDHLQEDNLMDLKTELSVLASTLQADGLTGAFAMPPNEENSSDSGEGTQRDEKKFRREKPFEK